MNTKEFVAYQGEFYTIEWFFDQKGTSQALEYFYAMNASQKRKLLMLLNAWGILVEFPIKPNFEMKMMAFMLSNHSQIDSFLSLLWIRKLLLLKLF
jgi:hypothetical protein